MSHEQRSIFNAIYSDNLNDSFRLSYDSHHSPNFYNKSITSPSKRQRFDEKKECKHYLSSIDDKYLQQNFRQHSLPARTMEKIYLFVFPELRQSQTKTLQSITLRYWDTRHSLSNLNLYLFSCELEISNILKIFLFATTGSQTLLIEVEPLLGWLERSLMRFQNN